MFLIFRLMFPHPTPSPLTLLILSKTLVASYIMPNIIVSCKFVTFDLVNITFTLLLQWYINITFTLLLQWYINITFTLLQWVLFLSSNNTFVNVRYVNFQTNLSVLPKCYQTNYLSSMELFLYVCHSLNLLIVFCRSIIIYCIFQT